MGTRKKNSRNAPFLPLAVWVLVVLVCVQGYFLNRHRDRGEIPAGKSSAVTGSRTVEKKTEKPARPPAKAKPSLIPGKAAPAGAVREAVVAVVLDDWGYNRTHCEDLKDMPGPLGVAILPGLPFSRDVIECSRAHGHDPMLHLPIEPHSAREKFDEEYLLTVDMSTAEVKKKLNFILNEMQGVVGVNNHTGSKGTEDEVLMTLVLAELKRRKLYFLDSFTSSRSVCGAVAGKLKMKIGRRDVFLDNRNEREAIRDQFAQVVGIARRKGHALAIGHDRALTLEVVREEMRKWQKEGVKFISTGEYIRRYEYSGD